MQNANCNYIMKKKLERLLLNKKFGELTAEEKYYATEFVSEAEYDQMHVLLKKGKKGLKNIPEIRPQVKNNLLAAFQQHHGILPNKKPNKIIQLISYRLPAWQMAAAIALLLGINFWLQEEPQLLKETETVYVFNTDTIYKEVSLPADKQSIEPIKPRINVKPVIKHSASNEPLLLASADTSKHSLMSSQSPDTFAYQVSLPRGRAASQTTELWELLGEVY